jgi:hypothetical protein
MLGAAAMPLFAMGAAAMPVFDMSWVADIPVLDMLGDAAMPVFDMSWFADIPVFAMGVVDLSDIPPIVPPALPMLEGGDIFPVGLLLAQPANTNAARTGTANS